ncbi:phosphoenolpyruvate carboxylase [Bdellovibrio sp. 22V]|uniref:phosphoenolpyruvate carboxylase n=1 Tax=Bdellovibrio sp. 22V TaxID=3044166 RepID=UPI002542B78F|nr:phosphoenolpyruvate carboxylase [Bdellovibrio sp. 22V]WII72193.1 phosphoenolpyruvate carboxylase [Bdellovibrio sp. 22V]
MKQVLPKELTSLVNWSVTELGKVIAEKLGQKGYTRIERIRRFVKSPEGQKKEGLLKLKKDLEKLSAVDQYAIAHAFSLMLELINSCESAYRTYRLQQEETAAQEAPYGMIIHVLTAHPTESRSSDIIYYFAKIQKLLTNRLKRPEDGDTDLLHIYLNWVWHLPMSKQRKPSVMDEAEYIYSLALKNETLKVFIQQRELKQPFYIRTWVGGDKDGHPGVDEKTMLGSLQLSRGFLYEWVQTKYKQYLTDLVPLAHSSYDKKDIRRLLGKSKSLLTIIKSIRKISHGDAPRVHKLRESFDHISKEYRSCFGVDAPALHEIRSLIRVFPGLVVPLEFREDSSLVHEALKGHKSSNIVRMLKSLDKISPHHDPRFYVRGFVLSNTESAEDIAAGVLLTKKYLKECRIPVVPLFESAAGLENSVAIINTFLALPRQLQVIKKFWSRRLEVMVGYSDSAKENGSLPSRVLIETAVNDLEKTIQSYDLEPIFFHGSGGSIERGGGSVQEQTAWWPASALNVVKVTVQGEMIYRNYSSSEILQRQLQRFCESRRDLSPRRTKTDAKTKKLLHHMASEVRASYQGLVQNPDFLDLIEHATPYVFLKDLKMGSRPAKRQGTVNLRSLRAIPWVLCWTQTRILFPTWWGVGSFWQSLTPAQKSAYKKAFREAPVFRSYIKALGFTLAKIELPVFEMYLYSSPLDREVVESFLTSFHSELRLCHKAFVEITGQKKLLWYREWLEESIHLRSPLIHPLNVLQLIALKNRDIPLLRETVTGVASGMLTTG